MSSDIRDVYAHVIPSRYFERVDSLLGGSSVSGRVSGYHAWLHEFHALSGLDERRRALDGIDSYRQIVMLAVPPLEELGDAALCADLARLANDEMAELVRCYPDRFAGSPQHCPSTTSKRASKRLSARSARSARLASRSTHTSPSLNR